MREAVGIASTLAGDDRVVIEATTDEVFAVLCAIEQWPRWWKGVGVARLDVPVAPAAPWEHQTISAEGVHAPTSSVTTSTPVAVVLDVSRPADLLRVVVIPTRVRTGIGWWWRLSGDVDATAEIWLEAIGDRTVIHHLSWWGTSRRASRLGVYRRCWRQGMTMLKGHVAAGR